ncbi:MAG: four-carbon acid sugar kinase family protein, partial [Roseobacter sp.]
VAEAVAECRAALGWLRAAGAERFFWKYCSTFDSTAEGNIGPVAEALMTDLDCRQTIYCPAFPENGRSVYMGNLFVGQLPLAESPMKDHPLTPMRDSNLMRLLAPQVTRPVGLVDRLTVAKGAGAVREALAALAARDVAHVVIDAVADEDLTTIATACSDMKLLTGGSALAMPLPKLYAQDGTLASGATPLQRPETSDLGIVLSGSCSAMTRAQVAEYLTTAPGYRLDPLRLATDGAGEALTWLQAQDLACMPIIYATAEPDQVAAAQEQLGAARAGEIVETALAELAVSARERGARRFVVAGGESSGAVTRALKVDRLTIGPEIAPGVPWTFCQSAGVDIALTLKSGNFGDVRFFSKAIEVLKEI